MRIFVIGGGGREHAIIWALTAGRSDVSVVCAPGNPGIATLASCRPADLSQPKELLAIAEQEGVDLTVVGPELPLSAGVADLFEAAGRPIVGPTRAAAALEWSKAFSKHFMTRHGVPTARFADCATADEAFDAIASGTLGLPIVVKADGLAAGKGVVIAEDRTTAEAAVREAMVERRFGGAGDRVVLEEFLVGQEASYFVLSDGRTFVTMSSAQDHKRIFDGDRGPNTGGMGAFAPSPLVTGEVETRVIKEVIEPVLAGMRSEGHPFRGFLYVGLMLTAAGPKVVEFNVRFGDPEAQVILPMLDEDLPQLLMSAATGTLVPRAARMRDERLVGVVIASAGYPESSESGRAISGLDSAARVPNALVFHAGTAARDAEVVTAGGRVLTIVGRGAGYEQAIAAAYGAVGEIAFEGMQFRTDIGRKALAASAGHESPRST
jgi:phosphoribosylamine---glycine ligase